MFATCAIGDALKGTFRLVKDLKPDSMIMAARF
ncbi:hypothetical protein PMIN01_03536 [Paraphaeosphaeria minitans]|uniref:Uncharacterized protein n=1 Tax=Paraphaeosphaeria minitans TaxID=565426 RepID=A0A9P6GND1_9PLEO|nr:hypothetical protein PMIN01_03536 [Paraphaeosphaeria minitans]